MTSFCQQRPMSVQMRAASVNRDKKISVCQQRQEDQRLSTEASVTEADECLLKEANSQLSVKQSLPSTHDPFRGHTTLSEEKQPLLTFVYIRLVNLPPSSCNSQVIRATKVNTEIGRKNSRLTDDLKMFFFVEVNLLQAANTLCCVLLSIRQMTARRIPKLRYDS